MCLCKGDKKSDREGGRESKGERGREIDPTEEKDMDGENTDKFILVLEIHVLSVKDEI